MVLVYLCMRFVVDKQKESDTHFQTILHSSSYYGDIFVIHEQWTLSKLVLFAWIFGFWDVVCRSICDVDMVCVRIMNSKLPCRYCLLWNFQTACRIHLCFFFPIHFVSFRIAYRQYRIQFFSRFIVVVLFFPFCETNDCKGKVTIHHSPFVVWLL